MDAAQFNTYWDEFQSTGVELMKLAKEQ